MSIYYGKVQIDLSPLEQVLLQQKIAIILGYTILLVIEIYAGLIKKMMENS